MDEIQRAQLNKLNQMVVDGENLNEEQKELRRELSALQRALAVNAVATSPGDTVIPCTFFKEKLFFFALVFHN